MFYRKVRSLNLMLILSREREREMSSHPSLSRRTANRSPKYRSPAALPKNPLSRCWSSLTPLYLLSIVLSFFVPPLKFYYLFLLPLFSVEESPYVHYYIIFLLFCSFLLIIFRVSIIVPLSILRMYEIKLYYSFGGSLCHYFLTIYLLFI